jgi:hypothetical protein
LELTIYDEDTNKSNEFIGKIAIPLLGVSEIREFELESFVFSGLD